MAGAPPGVVWHVNFFWPRQKRVDIIYIIYNTYILVYIIVVFDRERVLEEKEIGSTRKLVKVRKGLYCS